MRENTRSFVRQLFYTKQEAHNPEKDGQLHRCLSATDLTLMGIGGIIGAGIFVLSGIAAATKAGPAIIFSYILAGLTCALSAFAYAELASSVGGCGSAYGYAYAGLGEIIAWIIGWDLLLEYGLDCSTVSIGWSGYVNSTLSAFGIHLPEMLITGPLQGGIINLPATLIILALAWILSIGVKESVRFNKVIVIFKLLVVGLFISIAAFHFNPANWHPFFPFGLHGIVSGAGLIFFAYIGFDAVSTAGEEAKNPQRDLPISIIGSLLICTIIYVAVSALLTGIAHYPTLNVSSPVATALLNIGYKFSAEIIGFGAIAGLTTVMLVMYYGLTRIFLAMSRDGLLPKSLAQIHPKSKTPRRLILVVGLIMALAAGLAPINGIAQLVNIGTLAAFTVVCAGVIVLRKTRPDMPRPFKMPLYPVLPVVAILLCLYLMLSLPAITWECFLVWMCVGLVIYFLYGRHNSRFGSANKLPLENLSSCRPE